MFAELGLAYIGPVDGHDVQAAEHALAQARCLGRPALMHVVTVKGKGYPPAEADEADCFHAVGVIAPATGKPPPPRDRRLPAGTGRPELDQCLLRGAAHPRRRT
nr:1-deoxy-D-xylulose-5-phosphate synthase N-terminal domain-containing protein [Streptomyces sp. ISL-11]